MRLLVVLVTERIVSTCCITATSACVFSASWFSRTVKRLSIVLVMVVRSSLTTAVAKIMAPMTKSEMNNAIEI